MSQRAYRSALCADDGRKAQFWLTEIVGRKRPPMWADDGRFRRLPVAANTALAIAGTMPTFSSTYKIELMNLVCTSEAFELNAVSVATIKLGATLSLPSIRDAESIRCGHA